MTKPRDSLSKSPGRSPRPSSSGNSPQRPAYSAPPPSIDQPPKPPLLCYITDRRQFPGDNKEQCRQLLLRIAAAAEAGIDLIQLREKELASRDLENLAEAAVAAVAHARSKTGSRTRLLINSRVDVAIASGADGVHLRSGSSEISAADARDIFAKAGVDRPLIGVSCHSAEEVALAASQGADLAVFAPVFEKPGDDASAGTASARVSSKHRAGIEGLRRACAASIGGMAVLALGGVTLENASHCVHAGAAGIAGIRIFQRGDIAETIACLRALVPAASLT
jgi:thiamine-phosphate pyrophosphorylase